MRYIEDFKDGDRVIEHYLCRKKVAGKTKSGKTYYSLALMDKTGVIEAKIWDLNGDIEPFSEKDFVKVDGEIRPYNGELQLTVRKLRRSDEGEYVKSDYIPAGDADIEEVIGGLHGYIESVGSKHLRALLEGIIIKNPEISAALRTHSAAKAMHHTYMGGLAEHTLSVVRFCDFMSGQYKFVNRDLLIAAAMLHDIGKIFELSPLPDSDYTDDGQLLGHIVLCAELVTTEAARLPGFPPGLLSVLKHCILSHHGEYEFGSPKIPVIIEAYILSFADNADAKIKMFEDALQNGKGDGDWLGYNKQLARNIRRTGL